jgi:hypothetical protein
MTGIERDRVQPLFPAAALAFVLVQGIISYFDVRSGGIMLAGISIFLFLVFILWFLTYVAVVIWRLFRKRWRGALSGLLGLAVLLAGPYLHSAIARGTDYLRFQMNREHYEAVAIDGREGLTIIEWERGGWVFREAFALIVYDRDGNFLGGGGNISPLAKEVLLKSEVPLSEECTFSVRRIEGKFYSVVAFC